MFVYLLVSTPPLRFGRVGSFVFVEARAGKCARGSHAIPPKIEVAVSQFQSSSAHSLTSALHYLVPVRPRRQIVYPLEKLGINAPSKEVSRDAVGSRRQQAGRSASAGERAGGRGRWGGAANAEPEPNGCSFIPEPRLPSTGPCPRVVPPQRARSRADAMWSLVTRHPPSHGGRRRGLLRLSTSGLGSTSQHLSGFRPLAPKQTPLSFMLCFLGLRT